MRSRPSRQESPSKNGKGQARRHDIVQCLSHIFFLPPFFPFVILLFLPTAIATDSYKRAVTLVALRTGWLTAQECNSCALPLECCWRLLGLRKNSVGRGPGPRCREPEALPSHLPRPKISGPLRRNSPKMVSFGVDLQAHNGIHRPIGISMRLMELLRPPPEQQFINCGRCQVTCATVDKKHMVSVQRTSQNCRGTSPSKSAMKYASVDNYSSPTGSAEIFYVR